MKAAQRAVDVRFLAAGGAIGAGQRRAAIEAVRLMGVAVAAGLACCRLDRARQQSAGYRLADPIEIAHASPPALLWRRRASRC